MTTTLKRIWGLEYEEIYVDGKIFWRTFVRNPFKQNDHWRIGLNEKFFREARNRGVEKIILQIGERETMMSIPTKKFLKNKVKANEYEDRPSLFKDSLPMRIFYFNVI